MLKTKLKNDTGRTVDQLKQEMHLILESIPEPELVSAFPHVAQQIIASY
jgi:hypothetical protein